MKAGSVLAPPVISDADFQKFAEFFHRKTGIHSEPSKRYVVDKRLIERIQATGADTLRAGFVALRFEADGADRVKIIRHVPGGS